MQVPQGEQSEQIPVVRVWEREDMSGFVLTQVPWAGGSAHRWLLSYRNKLRDITLVCSWKMKNGKTGNKATASSVCHRLISTIECELNQGPAVPLCVTVLGIAVPGWRSFIPAKSCGQLK